MNKMIFSLNILLFSLVTLVVLIYFAKAYHNFRYFNSTYNQLKHDFMLFTKYLDRYYITNFYYTIFMVFIYIFGTVIIFLLLRALILGQITYTFKIEAKVFSLWEFISVISDYILFIFCIFLCKVLLEILCYREVLKLRIYLQVKHYSLIYKLKKIFTREIRSYICGFIWMLSYRIATANFNPNMFENEFDIWYHKQLHCNEHYYKFLYENIIIQKVVKISIYLSKNFYIFNVLFFKLAKLFNILHWYGDLKLFRFTPHMLLILVLLYELYNNKLYYIYYASFLFLIIRMIISLRKFEYSLRTSDIGTIGKYFYTNSLPYEKQRNLIIEENTFDMTIRENKNLFILFTQGSESRGLIAGLLNNLSNKLPDSPSDIRFNKQLFFTFLRNHILFTFIIITIFILFRNNIQIHCFTIMLPISVLFIPLIVMFYSTKKTFYREVSKQYSLGEVVEEYNDNKFYNIIFWLSTIIQGTLIWLIVFKPSLFFMSSDVILQLPYNILTITKIYTIEEKIQYILEYYNYYCRGFTDNSIINKEYLLNIIKMINYKELINDQTELNRLQKYVESLIKYSIRLNKLYAYNMDDLHL